MVHLLEFHARIRRTDGAMPRAVDLHVALHPSREAEQVLWEDTLVGVPVAEDGAFHLLLGEQETIDHAVFDGGARWVSVRIAAGARAGDEVCERVPVVGATVRLAHEIERIEARLGGSPTLRAGDGEALLRRRTMKLHRRLRRLEEGGGATEVLSGRLGGIEHRVTALDGAEGRFVRVEDEIEDLVGPDGDIIDLLERVERLEGRGPAPERLPPPDLNPQPRLTPHIVERLAGFERRLAELEARPAPAPPTPDQIHAVKRGGDTMTGGLTINRGGLDVLSGGIKARGAEVNSLEASLYVKAPKLVGDALEVRGDITVDSTKRTLQIRRIEGRAGSGRKDGSLVLNGRSGGEVEIGSPEAAAEGLLVHGPAHARGFVAPGSTVALAWHSGGEVHPGEVVGVNDHGHLIHLKAYDRRVVGVVADSPGLTLGAGPERKVMVVVGGVTPTRVDTSGGPIHAGDLLVAADARGRARKADDRERAWGAVVGKALGALAEGEGEIPVLVTQR